mgnify:CR=1 FL=1
MGEDLDISEKCLADESIVICSFGDASANHATALSAFNVKFKSMPGFKEVQNFPSSSDSLKEMKINNWYKFIFF